MVKETLRLFPVTASGTGRLVDRPTRLGDYHIPSGVVIGIPWYILAYAIQRSAKYFPRPDEFLPERWLAPEGKLERAQAGHFSCQAAIQGRSHTYFASTNTYWDMLEHIEHIACC